MTTDGPSRPSRVAPRVTLTPLEWRLAMVSLLAAAYVATWLALGSPRERTDAEPPALPTVTGAPAPSPRVVWIDALPPAERPPFVVPAGWQLASSEVAPARSPSVSRPRPVVTRARARRVRTRSS